MKIVCISDTHCQLGKVPIPNGDILIHSGDLTYSGSVAEISKELMIIGLMPHKYKIFVCGNHDWLGERNPTLLKEMCKDKNIIYLHDEEVIIDGLKFYGSPYQPEFFNWAFNLPRGEKLKEKWSLIPDDTNVLITHTPPKTILDIVYDESVGCQDLLYRVLDLKHLKLHTFGHIHYSYGQYNYFNTKFVNASICTENYSPKNKPIVIEL